MSRNGGVDASEWENLRDRLEKFEREIHLFAIACTKDLTARLLRKVIMRTPVGQYPRSSGKLGGTLRRGWTGGVPSNSTTYANSLTVRKQGTMYIVEIINPVHYSSYVEFGHRTRNHRGWVPGKFMLTISENEIRRDAPRILEQKVHKKLMEVFGS